jgi:hypothetical protein
LCRSTSVSRDFVIRIFVHVAAPRRNVFNTIPQESISQVS